MFKHINEGLRVLTSQEFTEVDILNKILCALPVIVPILRCKCFTWSVSNGLWQPWTLLEVLHCMSYCCYGKNSIEGTVSLRKLHFWKKATEEKISRGSSCSLIDKQHSSEHDYGLYPSHSYDTVAIHYLHSEIRFLYTAT